MSVRVCPGRPYPLGADNGEGNRDGVGDNFSGNCGAEGPTKDPTILALRERQQRNFLATLLLSQGLPMLCGGDEIGRTHPSWRSARSTRKT